MTDFMIPLGATISPWMIALIVAILVAGIVLVFLGMRRGKAGDPTPPATEEGSAAESLGLREAGEDTDLDDMLTDQTFGDPEALGEYRLAEGTATTVAAPSVADGIVPPIPAAAPADESVAEAEAELGSEADEDLPPRRSADD